MTVSVKPSAAVLVLAAFGGLLLSGCAGPEPTAVTTKFVDYNAKDGTFACEHPDGWKVEGASGRAATWARFTSGGSKIQIRATAAGSLMADAMGGRAADMNAETLEQAPVHTIHLSNVDLTAQDYGGYAEAPGGPADLDVRLGPARISEFTGTSYGPVHGYRVTAIAHEKGVRVVCVCPESEWTQVKPMFDHTLASLRRGVAE